MNNQRNSKRRTKNKQKRFVGMISTIILSLFVFAMCVSVFAASIGTDDTSNIKTQQDSTIPEYLSPDTIHTITYDELEVESIETEDAKTIETIEDAMGSEFESTEPVEDTNSYTGNDLYYLAAAICREAGGESEEIQLLVANVVINRVNSSMYPDTIYGVLTEYLQYGMMWKYGVSFPDWADEKTINQCYQVAKRILEGERVCPENVIFQAEFEQGSGIFKQFGNEYYFCYYG